MWRLGYPLVLIVFKLLYRVRTFGSEHLPESGGLIYVANHQSHFDPPIVGLLVNRRPFTSMARASLFKVPMLGPLIRALDAIPLERGRGDVAALRISIDVLKRGGTVLVFPEGSRTFDGALGEFKRGFTLLQKKSGATVLPVAIEGAFDVWPRRRSRPRLKGRIVVRAGSPLTPDVLEREGEEAVIDRVRREIETMRLELRAELRRRSGDRYPATGPGDAPFWTRADQVE